MQAGTTDPRQNFPVVPLSNEEGNAMKKLAAALAVAIALVSSGCAASEDAASEVETKASAAAQQVQQSASAAVDWAKQVEWSTYPDALKNKIDDLAAKDNCSGLNAELDKLDPNQDAALTGYIKSVARQAGCA
jgi:hypothetical protein